MTPKEHVVLSEKKTSKTFREKTDGTQMYMYNEVQIILIN